MKAGFWEVAVSDMLPNGLHASLLLMHAAAFSFIHNACLPACLPPPLPHPHNPPVRCCSRSFMRASSATTSGSRCTPASRAARRGSGGLRERVPLRSVGVRWMRWRPKTTKEDGGHSRDYTLCALSPQLMPCRRAHKHPPPSPQAPSTEPTWRCGPRSCCPPARCPCPSSRRG